MPLNTSEKSWLRAIQVIQLLVAFVLVGSAVVLVILLVNEQERIAFLAINYHKVHHDTSTQSAVAGNKSESPGEELSDDLHAEMDLFVKIWKLLLACSILTIVYSYVLAIVVVMEKQIPSFLIAILALALAFLLLIGSSMMLDMSADAVKFTEAAFEHGIQDYLEIDRSENSFKSQQFVDRIQIEAQCCGYKTYTDWGCAERKNCTSKSLKFDFLTNNGKRLILNTDLLVVNCNDPVEAKQQLNNNKCQLDVPLSCCNYIFGKSETDQSRALLTDCACNVFNKPHLGSIFAQPCKGRIENITVKHLVYESVIALMMMVLLMLTAVLMIVLGRAIVPSGQKPNLNSIVNKALGDKAAKKIKDAKIVAKQGNESNSALASGSSTTSTRKNDKKSTHGKKDAKKKT